MYELGRLHNKQHVAQRVAQRVARRVLSIIRYCNLLFQETRHGNVLFGLRNDTQIRNLTKWLKCRKLFIGFLFSIRFSQRNALVKLRLSKFTVSYICTVKVLLGRKSSPKLFGSLVHFLAQLKSFRKKTLS